MAWFVDDRFLCEIIIGGASVEGNSNLDQLRKSSQEDFVSPVAYTSSLDLALVLFGISCKFYLV